MKTLLIAIALTTLSNGVWAQATEEECNTKGHFFESAASFRDRNKSPQDALREIDANDLPIDFRKEAINLIYFNSSFKGLKGKKLSQQIFDLCLHGPHDPFEPLE